MLNLTRGLHCSEKEDDDVGIDLTAVNIVLIIDRNVEKEVMISCGFGNLIDGGAQDRVSKGEVVWWELGKMAV